MKFLYSCFYNERDERLPLLKLKSDDETLTDELSDTISFITSLNYYETKAMHEKIRKFIAGEFDETLDYKAPKIIENSLGEKYIICSNFRYNVITLATIKVTKDKVSFNPRVRESDIYTSHISTMLFLQLLKAWQEHVVLFFKKKMPIEDKILEINE